MSRGRHEHRSHHAAAFWISAPVPSPPSRRPNRTMTRTLLAPAFLLLASSLAHAAPINNPVAVFSGLDKITGRIITFDVLIDETVQFGALQVTPRVCHTRPPTEPAQTTTFVEVDEITLANEIRRLFTGWMFAASPGLHAVEHSIYDVWLVDCRTEMSATSTAPQERPAEAPPAAEEEPTEEVAPVDESVDLPADGEELPED